MLFPLDEATVRLHEFWQGRLSEARSHYKANPTPMNRREYLQILNHFSKMVVGVQDLPASEETGKSPRIAAD